MRRAPLKAKIPLWPTRLDDSILLVATPRTDFGRFVRVRSDFGVILLTRLGFRVIYGVGFMLRGQFAHTILTDSPI